MAITIDGDSGVSGVNGSATTPALQGTDSNTGIVFGTDTVQVATGGSTRATVDSSGRVLVGTSSAAKTYVSLGLQGNGASATNQATIALAKGALPSGADQELGRIEFFDNSGNSGASIVGISNAAWTSGSSHATNLTFSTTASGASSTTERMRINNAGQITAPSQPSFMAQRSGSYGQSGSDNAAPYNSTKFNRGSHYSTSTYRFTAPVAGHYLFFANVHRAGNNFGSLQIYKNNSTHYSFTEYESFDNNAHHYTIAIVDLAANDFVSVKGGNYNMDSNAFFGGYLLG